MHALCACCVCVRSNKRLHLEGVNEVILTLEHELREPCRWASKPRKISASHVNASFGRWYSPSRWPSREGPRSLVGFFSNPQSIKDLAGFPWRLVFCEVACFLGYVFFSTLKDLMAPPSPAFTLSWRSPPAQNSMTREENPVPLSMKWLPKICTMKGCGFISTWLVTSRSLATVACR